MTLAVLVALSVTLAFALAGPRLASRLPPAVAVRLLVPACLMMAASGLWVFVMVGFTWVAQLGPVSRYGDWSAEAIRADSPFPMIITIASGLLAVGSATRAALLAAQRIRVMRVVRRSVGQHGAVGSLVVLESERHDAFATPGAAGRIVVTTGLLRALSAAERRALIAHEASHLAHRHAFWLLATDVAAAANPLLLPTASAIEHAVERWADEDAAREVTDRRLVARTLARTALLARGSAGRGAASTGLALATGGDVPCRVRALLEPAPRPRILPLTVLLALLVTGTVADATVQRGDDQLLDRAGSVAALRQPAAPHHRTSTSHHRTSTSQWRTATAIPGGLTNRGDSAAPAPITLAGRTTTAGSLRTPR
jgi:Zn-dependent protease with chaperone function